MCYNQIIRKVQCNRVLKFEFEATGYQVMYMEEKFGRLKEEFIMSLLNLNVKIYENNIIVIFE